MALCEADDDEGTKVRKNAPRREPFRRCAKLTVLGSVAGFIAVFSTAPFAASSALAKCQPNRANDGVSYFDGWYNYAYEADGVYSTILNYSPWVQPNSEVSAWSMLTVAPGMGTGYAQVGWWEFAYGERHTFVQWTLIGGGFQTKFWSPQPTGSYTTYVRTGRARRTHSRFNSTGTRSTPS